MKHVKALLIKAGMVWAVEWIVLSVIYGVDFLDSTIIGVLVVGLAYLLGDMVILRKVGNIPATIADAGLAALVNYFYLSSMGYTENLWLMSLLAGALIGVGEWFFHSWLLRSGVIPDERKMT